MKICGSGAAEEYQATHCSPQKSWQQRGRGREFCFINQKATMPLASFYSPATAIEGQGRHSHSVNLYYQDSTLGTTLPLGSYVGLQN